MKSLRHPGLLITSLALILGVSCSQNQYSGLPAVADVEEILSSPNGSQYRLLASFDSESASGDIVAIGEPVKTARLVEHFITADFCDNVSGAPVPDYLPDFAGECIASILDIANEGYDSLFMAGQGVLIRSMAVRSVMAALDTACCLAPYDNEFRSYRPAAKAIVLSSPYMDICGRFDLDTLFRSTGADIPVIYPVRSAFARILSGARSPLNIAIIPDASVSDPAIYLSIFKDFTNLKEYASSTCIPINPLRTGKDYFRDFIASYAASGETDRIDAVLIDDDSIDIDALQASYRSILETQSEENLEFRKYLSRDMRFVYALDCAAMECHSVFRARNIFTHYIAYPKASAYITKNLPGQYVLVDYNPAYLPEGLEDMLKQSAPKSVEMYVQN